MISIRLVAALIAIVVVSTGALSGCGAAESLLRSRDTQVPLSRAPVAEVDAPDAALAGDAIVAETARSVVKIHSTAPGCQKVLEGSGVVMGPNRVMSNAHVVAGAETFDVSIGDEALRATVVLYEPRLDIAVLDVPGLQSPPLRFADEIVPSGTDALVLGYPGGGDFAATPARVRDVIELSGPDIYRTTTVKREVYVIRGEVGQGDSGGPLIDRTGRVLGINFGAAVDDPDTGFVLTAKQVYSQMVLSTGESAPVATGACVT